MSTAGCARLPTNACAATPGEAPTECFQRAEAGALRSIGAAVRDGARAGAKKRCEADCVVEIDSNAYSVPVAADRREREGNEAEEAERERERERTRGYHSVRPIGPIRLNCLRYS